MQRVDDVLVVVKGREDQDGELRVACLDALVCGPPLMPGMLMSISAARGPTIARTT